MLLVNDPYIDPAVLDEASNQAGRARAMTLFTPLWPGVGAAWVRLVFLVVRSTGMGGASIKELSFIHFARWGIVRRTADYGQPRDRLRLRPLFMFESNYNGSFASYIDAFAQIVGPGMSKFWGTSAGFPGHLPVGPFKTYIRANEFVTEHYYSAYPEASTTMVVQALETKRGVGALLSEMPGTPAAFDAGFQDLLRHRLPDYGQNGGVTVGAILKMIRGLVTGLGRTPNVSARKGLSYYFVSLVPILPNHVDALKGDLAELDEARPFADLPQAHFARFVILHEVKNGWAGGPHPPVRLKSPYLVFTAALTGLDDDDANALPGSFLDAFSSVHPELAHHVWKHCYGYEGTAEDPRLRGYLTRSQVGSVLFHVGYLDATVADVHHALELLASLEAFAAVHEMSAPEERRIAFEMEAPAW